MNDGSYEAGYRVALAAVDEYADGDRDKVWGSMVYACAGRNQRDGFDLAPCGHEERYYLGVGVEGPHAVRERFERAFQRPAEPWTDEGSRTLVVELERIGVGFIPAPAFAGKCPNCHGGSLGHVRWNEDETFGELRDPPEGARYFRVPDRPLARAYARDGYGGAELVVA